MRNYSKNHLMSKMSPTAGNELCASAKIGALLLVEFSGTDIKKITHPPTHRQIVEKNPDEFPRSVRIVIIKLIRVLRARKRDVLSTYFAPREQIRISSCKIHTRTRLAGP